MHFRLIVVNTCVHQRRRSNGVKEYAIYWWKISWWVREVGILRKSYGSCGFLIGWENDHGSIQPSTHERMQKNQRSLDRLGNRQQSDWNVSKLWCERYILCNMLSFFVAVINIFGGIAIERNAQDSSSWKDLDPSGSAACGVPKEIPLSWFIIWRFKGNA